MVYMSLWYNSPYIRLIEILWCICRWKIIVLIDLIELKLRTCRCKITVLT